MQAQHTWFIIDSRPAEMSREKYRAHMSRSLDLLANLAPRNRIYILAGEEDIGLLDKLFDGEQAPGIIVKPSASGNALPVFILLMEIERQDRQARVAVLPCVNAGDPERFLNCLHHAFATATPHAVSMLRSDACVAPVSLLLLLFLLAEPEMLRPSGGPTPERDFACDVLGANAHFLRDLKISDCGLERRDVPAADLDPLQHWSFIFNKERRQAAAPPRRFFH